MEPNTLQTIYAIDIRQEPHPGHTDQCLFNAAAVSFAQHAFDKQFPNACTACNGTGYHSYDYDPSPAGVSLAPGYMTVCEPCSECFESDSCPLCGGALSDEITHPTDKFRSSWWVCKDTACGWSSDDYMQGATYHARPEDAECDCWGYIIWRLNSIE